MVFSFVISVEREGKGIKDISVDNADKQHWVLCSVHWNLEQYVNLKKYIPIYFKVLSVVVYAVFNPYPRDPMLIRENKDSRAYRPPSFLHIKWKWR